MTALSDLNEAIGPRYRGRPVDEFTDDELVALISELQRHPRPRDWERFSSVSPGDAAARRHDPEYKHLWWEMLDRDIWPWPDGGGRDVAGR